MMHVDLHKPSQMIALLVCVAVVTLIAWGQGALGRPRSVHVMDFGAVGDGITDDSKAFAAAITNMRSAAGKPPLQFGGGRYLIANTIRFGDIEGIVVDGQGAVLVWGGPPDTPMILIEDVRDSVFRDFKILSSRQNPLAAAIRSQNGEGNAVVPTQNRFENIQIEGTQPGGLGKGFQFALGPGGDNNNDINSFYDCSVRNYGTAAWSFEHSQSVRHALIRCRFSGNRAGQYGVTTGDSPGGNGGQFSIFDGAGGGNTVADFFLGAPNRPVQIVGFESENSTRLLVTNGGTGAFVVRLQGIRYADNSIHSDRAAVIFSFPGPLEISSSQFGSGGTGAVQIRINAGSIPGYFRIYGNNFLNSDSASYDPVDCRQCRDAVIDVFGNLYRGDGAPYVK